MRTKTRWTEAFAQAVTKHAGSTPAFLLAASVILAWVVSGPVFGFSDTWQLVINTATTIITFLMVFLIQRAQNKESQAIHLKLNEIVAALEGSSNRLINAEDLSEEEICTLHRYYAELARLAKHNGGITDSHSIEEAESKHEEKHAARKR